MLKTKLKKKNVAFTRERNNIKKYKNMKYSPEDSEKRVELYWNLTK